MARLYLPDCYSMRFTTLSNFHLIDWWCDVSFICLSDDLIQGFCFSYWHGKPVDLTSPGNPWTWPRKDYHFCITSKPTDLFLIFLGFREDLLAQITFSEIMWSEHSLGEVSIQLVSVTAQKVVSNNFITLVFALYESLFPCQQFLNEYYFRKSIYQ